MSFYNAVFGMNPSTDQLLSLLGKTKEDFGRFRNVYVEDGYIVVHTRNGGGNREDYEDVFAEMATHPWYSHDADEDFDCTYADIYFKVPEGENASFVGLLDPGVNPEDQWNSLLEAMKS